MEGEVQWEPTDAAVQISIMVACLACASPVFNAEDLSKRMDGRTTDP